MIHVEHLTKKFGSITALDGVSFDVKRGEVLGFLGPNGAGKTTAMRILTGFFPPTSGRVLFDGQDFEKRREINKRHIGYLPEMVPLYDDLTTLDFLSFVAKVKGVPRSRLRGHIRQVMSDCGIEDVASRYLGKLSKGYRQRVGLAQALIGSPDLLILDEPTTGLDPKQIIEIRSLIKRLAGQRTVILSTHILPEVSLICQRIMIINKGRIVASDTPENLTRQLAEKHEIRILVEGPAESILAAIHGVGGVRDVQTNPVGPRRFECFVYTDIEEDLRSQLAEHIVKNGLRLLEIGSVKMTLEDIFVELVTEEKGLEAQ